MYESRGSLLLIHDVQTFASGFTKREFVINTNDKYPQQLKFELVKERCSVLDQFAVGDDVAVSFDIRGNEYNGKHYVSLSCWKIQMADGPGAAAAPPAQSKTRAGNGGYAPSNQRTAAPASEPSSADLRNEGNFDDDDEIPF